VLLVDAHFVSFIVFGVLGHLPLDHGPRAGAKPPRSLLGSSIRLPSDIRDCRDRAASTSPEEGEQTSMAQKRAFRTPEQTSAAHRLDFLVDRAIAVLRAGFVKQAPTRSRPGGSHQEGSYLPE